MSISSPGANWGRCSFINKAPAPGINKAPSLGMNEPLAPGELGSSLPPKGWVRGIGTAAL
jgi:hypothetical protein